jgi:regulator of RNase E activity RraA
MGDLEERMCPMAEPGVMDGLVARLSRFDSCTVSDACDALGVDRAVTGLRPVWEGARVCGRVVTVELAEVGDSDVPSAPVHLGVRAIEASEPGDVIVVANEGRIGMGGWGGLLATAAQRVGVAGVVVDGACRDVDEARELGFPVFARAGVPRTARGRVREVATGGRVRIAGIAVDSGDVIVADGSGVVVVSAADLERVVAEATRIHAREAEMVAALGAGVAIGEVLDSKYERMLDRD